MTPISLGLATICHGDCREVLKTLPASSVHCCVTSPPFWNLRDYGVPGQIGMERTPSEYITAICEVFSEVWRVLRDDGTLWLNMGDSYVGGGCGARDAERWPKQSRNDHMPVHAKKASGLKSKDLVGMPWRVAFALQDAGWYLRSDIIWHKPNPMPESVTDRPTKAHEYIFLLSKSPHYYYDAEAIKEPVTGNAHTRGNGVNPKAIKVPSGWDQGSGSHTKLTGRYRPKQNASFSAAVHDLVLERNKRSVWTVATQGFSDAHFATFPEKLIEPCILAGCPADGVVLDPFAGSGTTLRVATRYGRRSIGIELNPEYLRMVEDRTTGVQMSFRGAAQ